MASIRLATFTASPHKSDKLLLNILPESIAERLKNGESPIADDFEDYAEVSDTLGQLPGAIALPQRITPLYLGSERYKRDSKISLGSEKESTVSFVNIDIEGGMRGPRMSHAVVRAVFTVLL